MVCPEIYEDPLFNDLPGSSDTAVRFVRWLVEHVREACHVTLLTNPAGSVTALDELLASVGGTHRIEVDKPVHATLSREFIRPQGRLDDLRPDDAFVLYWLGHGAVNRSNYRHSLYLPYRSYMELEDIQAYMRKRGRPDRQLYVIDACRERDRPLEVGPYGFQPVVAAASEVPNPDWGDQLVLYAARQGEQAAINSAGGAFSSRLIEALTRLPQRDRLEMQPVIDTAVALEGEFFDEHQRFEVDHIPTHVMFSGIRQPDISRDYRHRITVSDLETDRLCAIIAAAEITALQEGEVRGRLAAAGLRLAEPDAPLPELAGKVARLPLRDDGHHYLVTLCATLATISGIGTEIRDWYASLTARAALPELPLASFPSPVEQEEYNLVVEIHRTDEEGHITGQIKSNPLYAIRAWFYAGHEPREITFDQHVWRRSQFPEAIALIYEQSSRQVVRAELSAARVEFLVDRDLFDERFDNFPTSAVETGVAPQLGDTTPVVLRDRWRYQHGTQLMLLERRATLLDSVPAASLLWDACVTPADVTAVRRAFNRGRAEPVCAGIVLAQPRSETPALHDNVGTALNNGAAVVVWPHRQCREERRDDMVAQHLCRSTDVRRMLEEQLSGRPLKDVPDIIFDLRHENDEYNGVFRDMAVLFDDPRRSPLVRTLAAQPIEGDGR